MGKKKKENGPMTSSGFWVRGKRKQEEERKKLDDAIDQKCGVVSLVVNLILKSDGGGPSNG